MVWLTSSEPVTSEHLCKQDVHTKNSGPLSPQQYSEQLYQLIWLPHYTLESVWLLYFAAAYLSSRNLAWRAGVKVIIIMHGEGAYPLTRSFTCECINNAWRRAQLTSFSYNHHTRSNRSPDFSYKSTPLSVVQFANTFSLVCWGWTALKISKEKVASY